MLEMTNVNNAEEAVAPSSDNHGEEIFFDGEVTSDATSSENDVESAASEATEDYAAIIENDLKELRESFPELRNMTDVTDLKNPTRFAALRDLGLTATEAYLALGGGRKSYDNRAHLTATVPAAARVAGEIPRHDYDVARELFSDMSDSDIRKLYRKVTK